MASTMRARACTGASCSGRQHAVSVTSRGLLRSAAPRPVGQCDARRPAVRPLSSSKDEAPTSQVQAQPQLPGVEAFLASAEDQTMAFKFLSYTSAAVAALALIFPSQLLDFAFGTGVELSGLDEEFLRIAGATMVLSAAVESRLADAAANKRLKSATYQRLSTACCIKSVGYLLAFAQSSSLWTPQLWAFYPTLAFASIVINYTVLMRTEPDFGRLFTPSMPQNSVGWAYALFLTSYLATVGACYAPEAIYTGAPVLASSELLKHTWAPGFLLAAAVCFVQQDAADRSRLGAGTFRTLNLGLAGLEVLYAILLLKGMKEGLVEGDVSTMSNLVGSLAIAASCGWQYRFARKGK